LAIESKKTPEYIHWAQQIKRIAYSLTKMLESV